MTPKELKEFGYYIYVIETLFKFKGEFVHFKIVDRDREIGLRKLAEELQILEAGKVKKDLMVFTIRYELRDKRIVYAD